MHLRMLKDKLGKVSIDESNRLFRHFDPLDLKFIEYDVFAEKLIEASKISALNR